MRRLLHALWAALGIAVTVLILRSRGGHPPALIFLPLVLAAWVAGHLLLWLTLRLAAAGRRRVEAGGGAGTWPPSLALAMAGTAVIAVGGLALLARLLIDRDLSLDAWNATLLAVWLPHAVCFPALLLRLAWSRWLAAALAVGWALLLVRQIFTTNDVRPWDLPVALLLIAALLSLALRLATSARVRAVLPGGSQ